MSVGGESAGAGQSIARYLGTVVCLSAVFAATSGLQAQSKSFPPSVPPAKDADSADSLLSRVSEAIEVTKMRHLDFQQHTPWQILHGLLALRENYAIKNGNEFVNALDFMSTKARYKGEAWFEATSYGGRAHPYNGTPYDFEGHVNQSLAIIAMCNVPLTHEFQTGSGRQVTMADMVRHAQMAVNNQEELTWTLWFLTHYLDQDTTWTNAQGQRWSMEALVRTQNTASVLTAPCGGCHNLFALAYARNSYMQKHGQLRGAWLEADNKLQQYISTAQAMQNRDGSFAVHFFRSRGYSADFNERIKSTGHLLEWLLVALPKERLNEPWLQNGVQSLANDLIVNATQPADCGPLYHSLHALVLYQQRMQAIPKEQLVAKPELPEDQDLTVPAESQPSTTATDATPKNPLFPESAGTKPAMNTPQDNTQNATVESKSSTENPSTETSPPPTGAPTTLAPNKEAPAMLGTTVPARPPVLVAPPQATQPGSSRAPRRSPFRRLSSDGESADAAEELESENSLDPSRLTPIQGGMPIFQRTAPEAAGKTEAGKTTAEETTAPAEKAASAEPKPDAGSTSPSADSSAPAEKEPATLPQNSDAKPASANPPEKS